MAEDRGLEVLEPLVWVEAELVEQRCAGVAVGGEGVCLAAGAVEGEHEQPAQVLAHGLVADEGFELGDGLGVAAQGELGFGAKLLCGQSEPFESAGRVAGEALVLGLG